MKAKYEIMGAIALLIAVLITGCSAFADSADVGIAVEEAPVEGGVVSQPETNVQPPAEEVQPEPVQEQAPAAASSPTVFTLDPAQTQAQFVINEVLNGTPKTVIGTTASGEGTISVDYADLSTLSMSTITVDLSGLQTDSSLRTRTLHSNILQTGNEAFRYATFSATGFSGLPASASVGETYNFQINGDLSIHGVTRSVTFDATVTPVSATRLEGNASLEILWGDYGIGVFRLPEQVASVEDKVIVGLIFVAEAG